MNTENQTMATKNQIKAEKPEVKKTYNKLEGFIGNSCNGGMLRTVAWKPIMAGTYDAAYRLKLDIKMLTPLVPAFQKLSATFRTYFVPNTAVWKNAQAFEAQKGGSTVTKISKVPTLPSTAIPSFTYNSNSINYYVKTIDTEMFRDSYVQPYLNSIQRSGTSAVIPSTAAYPEINALLLRGFRKIYNDFERNKEYDTPFTEYDGDTVSNNEFNEYFPAYTNGNQIGKNIIRGKRPNSYYTDYRTELLGQNPTAPTSTGAQYLVDTVSFEQTIAELRSQSENSQLNDWDIIAKIRGAKRATQGKVQLLGTHTIGLNYQAITQSTYNVNPNVADEFQAMGTQGAYSFTQAEIPCYNNVEFIESGYIHVIMQVSAENVFETGVERCLLNVNALDQYRPDMKDIKHDVIYSCEKNTFNMNFTPNYAQVDGFKRKFSEYFKLPNVLGGDISNIPYFTGEFELTTQSGTTYREKTDGNKIPTQKHYQFFEEGDTYTNGIYKQKWKDYTDLLINDNQAVKQQVENINNIYMDYFCKVKGQNQIFFVGIQESISDLPIDESIKNNFTKWGEK